MRSSHYYLVVGLLSISGLLTACGLQSAPVSGEWMAAADFGRIGFTVGSDGASIAQSRYDVNEFNCAGSTISAGVQRETQPAALIVDGSFHEHANLNVEGTLVMDITVDFSENGQWAHGHYEIVLPGGTCSGEFEAFPDGMGALY